MNIAPVKSGVTKRGVTAFVRAALSHANESLLMIAMLLAVLRSIALIGAVAIQGVLTSDAWWRLPSSLLAALCLLTAVLLAEEGGRRGWRRLPTYAMAVLAAAVTAAGLFGAFVVLSCHADLVCPSRWSRPRPWAWLLFIATDVVTKGALVSFLYANRELMLRSIRSLQTSTVERLAAEQSLAESRLEALRSRIDPCAVLETLRHARRLSDSEPAQAAQLLDELTLHLRDAATSVGGLPRIE